MGEDNQDCWPHKLLDSHVYLNRKHCIYLHGITCMLFISDPQPCTCVHSVLASANKIVNFIACTISPKSKGFHRLLLMLCVHCMTLEGEG